MLSKRETKEATRLYDVHFYALVRVKRCGIAALSQPQAIEVAERDLDLSELFDRLDRILPCETELEFAKEVLGYLVDEQGDGEYSRSQYYCQHRQPQIIGQQPCSCKEHRRRSCRKVGRLLCRMIRIPNRDPKRDHRKERN